MNAIELAHKVYTGPAAPVRTARQTEHQVFAAVTARLKAALGSTEPGAFARLVAALQDNRRLWTTLAVDVASKDNRLPTDLRARIFYLAEFTGHHTACVLRSEADAQVLIDVNTAIMRGLGALPGPAAAPRGPQ